MSTVLFEELQEIHVTGWNERDREKRDTLLRKIYAEDIKMYDAGFIVDGINAVSDFIGKLITEDPKYHFSAAKKIEPLQNSARLFGHIQTSGGLLNSTDFFILEEGKVKHLYAFIEPAVN
ncbi:glyoxalase [Flavipsychrobacter stenotrophus]|uniref:Glyoxalase n=1 Tax=Flavipsychrobacter stenotrophus TaxID=2077091 RepID=A0A2S7SSY6_9BACT|nr:nuclear transport factor 2 family protein [Flavipsychrobacter stenotrophus]PQJ09717.1 glyoxalase [Flavipsychrobacter stenotrophus]